MTPQAAKSVPAPTFGAIKPPPRKRRSGAEVSPELLSALATALETANGDWTGDGLEYPTLGKAQSASQRLPRHVSRASQRNFPPHSQRCLIGRGALGSNQGLRFPDEDMRTQHRAH